MGISLSRHPQPGQQGAPDTPLAPGTYLTDESRLFCFLGREGNAALLEDCRSLEVIAFPIAKVLYGDMRVIERAPRAPVGVAS